MRRRYLVAIGVAMILVASGCGSDGTPSSSPVATTASPGPAGNAAAATVELRGIAFKPSAVTVKTGETVAWRWNDGMTQHDVVFEGFHSDLQSAGTYRHAFAQAGTFAYHCSVHPQMTGVVEVTAG